ncbi:hypothetical protein M0R45_023169 [Rubus argutus]|uniref:Uncharacterized protein n=1 Tax=Rubus argutus TaxID=59490 RepID=A0AAW1WP13_RUBAR
MAQNLLRAKHIGNLSSSARSFFLSGSRCSATEGNSCTCSEDENCVPQRQQARNRGLLAQNPSSTVQTFSKGRILISGDAVKVADSRKSESVDHASSIKQVATAPVPFVKSDTVSYASNVDAVQKDVTLSPLAAEQFVKAGVAAVNFLSDIVSYKIPLSDGMGMLNMPKTLWFVPPWESPVSNHQM